MKLSRLTCGVVIVFVLTVTPCLALITVNVEDTSGSPVSDVLVTFTDESNPDNKFSSITGNDGKCDIPMTPTLVRENIPTGFHLDQNYPNPFNPSTTIPFSLNEAGYINLSIYNITGQKVRTLVDNYHSVGSHTVTWNGLDDSGKSPAAGLYIYQLKFGDTVESRKMLLIDGGANQIVTGTTVRAKSANNAENITYFVTITGDDIEPYEESGITIVDGGTYDFVVVRKTSEILGITFVSIPGGTFEMGDEDGEWDWCMPVHSVTVSGFDMSTTEITNEQYAAYLNEALASGDIRYSGGSVRGQTGDYSGKKYIILDGYHSEYPGNDCKIVYSSGSFDVKSGYEKWPVTWVTWYGSKSFAQYYGLDLPTEAEWEYAARGGKQYKYGTDDGTISDSKANYNFNIGYCVDVGSYPSNPFGLKDMSGNVFDWCNDWYGSDYYASSPTTNPKGPTSGSVRVGRGGNWTYDAALGFCRSARRADAEPGYGSGGLGFRVVSR